MATKLCGTLLYVDGRNLAIGEEGDETKIIIPYDNDVVVEILGIDKPHISHINNGDSVECRVKNGSVFAIKVVEHHDDEPHKETVHEAVEKGFNTKDDLQDKTETLPTLEPLAPLPPSAQSKRKIKH